MISNKRPQSNNFAVAGLAAAFVGLGAFALWGWLGREAAPVAPEHVMAPTPQTVQLEAAPAKLPIIAYDPTHLPAPLPRRAPQLVRVDLEAVEVEGRLGEGTSYTYFTFGGHVPGPFVRVRVGDTVEVHLTNPKTNTMMHSVDFHAATGMGGGGAASQAMPGETKVFRFKASHAGLFVYHCASPLPAQHISNGQYGLILVEPEEGLPKVDREFYVMQGELYTTAAFGTQGRQQFDATKLLKETPEYFVFNGATDALTKTHPLKAKVGETVRIFFGVGGPNFISTFHVIGEVFDRVYSQGDLTQPLRNTQSALTGPGSASVVEMKLEYPGKFPLVDHALSRAAKGLTGTLIVEGKPDNTVFQALTPITNASGH
ncbi:MAG: nitrite reductase, copper-containing [Meiothermus sp.]